MEAKGVFTIMPTPFHDNGALDERSLRRLVDFQLDAGVNGLAILGFMGEAHKLTMAERRQVIEIVMDQVAGRIPVWVGVRAFGTTGCVEQAQEAEQLGAHGVFVAPISVQNDRVLFEHYRTVAESIGIPVAIHDFPQAFGTVVSADVVARLVNEVDGVRYIKLEEPPVGPKITKLMEATEGKIGIFGGLGGTFFIEELQRGAVGTMTGFSFPEVLVRIYEQFSRGDEAGAIATFDRYCPLLRYEFQPGLGLAFRKYVYHKRGIIDSAYVRPPAAVMSEVDERELTAVVERVGLSLRQEGVQPVGV